LGNVTVEARFRSTTSHRISHHAIRSPGPGRPAVACPGPEVHCQGPVGPVTARARTWSWIWPGPCTLTAGCVAPGHRIGPAQSMTRPARRFSSAGITRVRYWESPPGRSHLASQPSLRTISRGKFPGRVRGLAPPLVSQALSPCPAPQAILRAGRPDCEGLWSRTGPGLENVTGRRDLRPWRQASRHPDSQILEAQK
jgi:hypothetical protein